MKLDDDIEVIFEVALTDADVLSDGTSSGTVLLISVRSWMTIMDLKMKLGYEAERFKPGYRKLFNAFILMFTKNSLFNTTNG